MEFDEVNIRYNCFHLYRDPHYLHGIIAEDILFKGLGHMVYGVLGVKHGKIGQFNGDSHLLHMGLDLDV